MDNANIPAFLGKLWKMVNDPSTDHLISWGPGGKTFIIQNEAQFWYELLPLYYKHNNMSSFVRQLNMYGFHKISNLENQGLAFSSDKDDSNHIQFYHPCFQQTEPEKLKMIKRKGTTNTKQHEIQTMIRQDDLTKVLTDIKQLRGRQTSVDSQLSAMKQENAVLWRELAILRQKHVKQQQIVNKLIQFLVSLVQPSSTTRMGVGVKRRVPLMIHENPAKKSRTRKPSRVSNDSGPSIHEVESVVNVSPEEFLDESVIRDDSPLINSPLTSPSSASQEATPSIASPSTDSQNGKSTAPKPTPHQAPQSDISWDNPDYVTIEDINDGGISDNEEDMIKTLQNNAATAAEKVFFNPSSRDALIGNLLNTGTYNMDVLQGRNINSAKKTNNKHSASNGPMQVAPKKSSNVKINTEEDLDDHVDTTQVELDQLKDILNGCNTLDAQTLLGLFSDNDPDYGIRGTLQNKDVHNMEGADPMMSGNEVAPAVSFIDFNELFEDDLNSQEDNLKNASGISKTFDDSKSASSSINTPQSIKNEPTYSLYR